MDVARATAAALAEVLEDLESSGRDVSIQTEELDGTAVLAVAMQVSENTTDAGADGWIGQGVRRGGTRRLVLIRLYEVFCLPTPVIATSFTHYCTPLRRSSLHHLVFGGRHWALVIL